MQGKELAGAINDHTYNAMDGLVSAIADYKNEKGAIGYSFACYVKVILGNDATGTVKILSVNGILPAAENIASGAYPFSQDFYAIRIVKEGLAGNEKVRYENTSKFIEWIQSAEGRQLV